MGFSYRKSVNLGPFRVNLSQSGFGYSVGGRGFRTGVSARGRRYTSFGLPGIGLSYRKSGGCGCLILIAAVDLHYLTNGAVAGTVVLLHDSALKDADIEPLLSALDDEFLPDVDLAHGNLTYTVVLGEVLGNWEASNN